MTRVFAKRTPDYLVQSNSIDASSGPFSSRLYYDAHCESNDFTGDPPPGTGSIGHLGVFDVFSVVVDVDTTLSLEDIHAAAAAAICDAIATLATTYGSSLTPSTGDVVFV
jgi:hypothetical protein